MTRYVPTIRTSNPETLDNLHPGQWIDYDGAKGRYMGRKNGSVWIAWGSTARKRFASFAMAFHTKRPERARPAPAVSRVDVAVLVLALAYVLVLVAFESGRLAGEAPTVFDLLGRVVPGVAPWWD